MLIDTNANTSEVIANMRVAEEVPKSVSRRFPRAGETPERAIADVAEIKKRGVLRVGYRPSNVPFSYYNNQAELVGFDVEMASMLASDLEVNVEFIPFKKGQMTEALNKGYFDIAMSGLAISIQQMQTVNYTTPVMELNRALAVPDYQIKNFKDLDHIRAMKNITIAYAEHDETIEDIRPNFPNIEFTAIPRYKSFFQQKNKVFFWYQQVRNCSKAFSFPSFSRYVVLKF